MKKSTNKNTAINTAVAVEAQIEMLENARVAWEEGAYKKSNEELYELLNNCLTFYQKIRHNRTECKALNALLVDRGITFNDGTSLQTRIVRAVFGADCRKRAYAYARVITVAANEKSPKDSMYNFITQRGGVEEIRRTKANGKTPAVSRKDKIEVAIDALESAEALTTPFAVNASQREMPEGATHSLFVAIMRQEADGTYSMVYETSTASVVNKALEDAGKEKNADAEVQAKKQQQRDDASDAESAADAAVNAAELAAAA